MTGQPPGCDDSKRFRLVEGGALPDTVVAAQRWCEQRPGTRAALNAFDITFDGRLSAGRK